MRIGHKPSGKIKRTGIIATCWRSWTINPECVEGATAELVGMTWYNGEHHATLRKDDGTVFVAPDIFWKYDEDAADAAGF